MKKYYIIILVALVVSFQVSAQVSVITNKSAGESTLNASALGNIYSLTMTKWNNGSKIVVIDRSAESPVKSSFYNYIGKDPLSIKKEWMKKQLTGEAKAPESLGSDEDIVAKVSSTPGAIGYVKSSAVNSSVKVVAEFK